MSRAMQTDKSLGLVRTPAGFVRENLTATAQAEGSSEPSGAMDRFLIRRAAEPITFEEHFERLFRECLDVMVERQRKYGPHNIPKFGTYGTLVRMGDKFERLMNLHGRAGDWLAVDETIEDTLIDIANYATIMRAQLRGIWTADQCPPLMNYQEEPGGERS